MIEIPPEPEPDDDEDDDGDSTLEGHPTRAADVLALIEKDVG